VRVFSDIEEFRAAKGSQLGVSDWFTVEQQHIDRFAEATGDHQWIHVDPARAADGPFGSTIAHGFLTLSLLPVLSNQVYRIDNVKMGINYGLNRVRFTSPVPVGSRVRAVMRLDDVEDVKGGAVQITTTVTIEIEGSERPALVAEWLLRRYV
jgi:acyl dehydratase